MKYLQIIFHIDANSADDIRKEIWFEIPWMSQEARRVSFDGHTWCQHIRSGSYPDISICDLWLLGNDEEQHASFEHLYLETAQVLPWMGVTLENLLYWDRRCHRSNKIYTREKEDRKSILFIDNEPIEFNSKTQEKLVHLFLTGANQHLRDMFNRA